MDFVHHLKKEKEDFALQKLKLSSKIQHWVSFHNHLHLPEALFLPVHEIYVYEGAVEGNFDQNWSIHLIYLIICSLSKLLIMISCLIRIIVDRYNSVISA